MIEPEAGGFGRIEDTAIDRDAVFGADVCGGRSDGLAVDGDGSLFDEFLRIAARRNACAGDNLGDTLALCVLCVHARGDSTGEGLAEAALLGWVKEWNSQATWIRR